MQFYTTDYFPLKKKNNGPTMIFKHYLTLMIRSHVLQPSLTTVHSFYYQQQFFRAPNPIFIAWISTCPLLK